MRCVGETVAVVRRFASRQERVSDRIVVVVFVNRDVYVAYVVTRYYPRSPELGVVRRIRAVACTGSQHTAPARRVYETYEIAIRGIGGIVVATTLHNLAIRSAAKIRICVLPQITLDLGRTAVRD